MKRAVDRAPARLSSRRRSRNRRTVCPVSALPLQYLSHGHVTYALYYAAVNCSGGKFLRCPFFESVSGLCRVKTGEVEHSVNLSRCEIRPWPSLRSAFPCSDAFQAVRVELSDPLLNVGSVRSKELTNLCRRFAFGRKQNDLGPDGLLLV